MIKLAIVDDEKLLVELLNDHLNESDNIDVIIKAFDGKELLEKLAKVKELPQVALTGMRMKGMNGIDTLKELKEKYPNIKTIIMSSYYKKDFTGFMVKYGANAFIPKGLTPEEIENIITEVCNKGFYIIPEQIEALSRQISNKAPQPPLSTLDEFTKREMEVLLLICQQKTGKEISELLNLSKRTVEGHRRSLLTKIRAKNTAGLVLFAVKNKLINIDKEPIS